MHGESPLSKCVTNTIILKTSRSVGIVISRGWSMMLIASSCFEESFIRVVLNVLVTSFILPM